jgi:hypothetical protein
MGVLKGRFGSNRLNIFIIGSLHEIFAFNKMAKPN